jgi:hypothetical protein
LAGFHEIAAGTNLRGGARKMLKLLLGCLAVAFLVFAPSKVFATTKSGIYAKSDTSIMYRRRHGADDGDEDDMPGGARAGDDDRDQDDIRQADDLHRELSGSPDSKNSGKHDKSDGKAKPQPDPIGR